MGEGRVRVKQERRNLRNKKTLIDNCKKICVKIRNKL